MSDEPKDDPEAPDLSRPHEDAGPLSMEGPPSRAPAPRPDDDPFGLGPISSAPRPEEDPKPIGAISSGPFEISRASFADNLSSEDLPPSTAIANAMGRNNKGLPLRTIVGITAGVLVVSVGLSLLLFR